MDDSKYADVMGIVFMYLNDTELNNAAKVCRSWQKIAKNEENLRGPSCDTRIKRSQESGESWYHIKMDILTNNGARSGIQLFFTDDEKLKDCNEGCHCENLPLNSYSVILENLLTANKEKIETTLISLFFPKTYNTKIATYTFIQDTSKQGLFCPEINFHCGVDIGKVKFLQTHMQSYFRDDRSTSSCMLLFCNNSNIDLLIDLLLVLSNWFPRKRICIWGGIVDSISVCQCCGHNIFCNVNVNYLLIFISNPRIAAYTETLDDNCNDMRQIKEKLINFKRRVLFRTHAVALINTSDSRMNSFFAIERYIFQQIFPDIKLFHIIGKAAFIGQGLRNVKNTMPVRDPENQSIYLETTIMIITYD